MTERIDDPAVLTRLLDHSPYIAMQVDGAGVIRWCNHAVDRLFGLDVDDIIGTNVLDYLDPTWDASALATIGDALGAEGLRLPTYLRTILPDGSKPIFEVWANAQLHDPVVQGLVAFLRPWDERLLLDRALEAMVAGEPVDETLRLLVLSMVGETLEADGAVLYEPRGSVFGHCLASEHLEQALIAEMGGSGPWTAVIDSGTPAMAAVGDLPAAVRLAAGNAGYAACWAWPISDDAGGVAGSVVAWRRSDQREADHSRREMMDRLARVAGLAISRAAQLTGLRYAATHDQLTGLANRAHFYAELESLTGAGAETADTSPEEPARPRPNIAVLYLDLDGFKTINDNLGHSVGDEVLQLVAERLRSSARRTDLVARLGGDEFAVLCPAVDDVGELEALATRLHAAIAAPIVVGTREISVGVSTGIALGDPRVCDADELVEAADAQLYEVKDGEKGAWSLASSWQAERT